MTKKKIVIFSIVILILLIIAFICIFHKEKPDKVSNMYNKVLESQNFTFSMEEQTDDFKYKVVMAQRGNDISIDMYSEDGHTTTIILNNEKYFYIMHDTQEYQEYYDYGSEIVDSDMILYELKNIIKEECISGKEKIDGKEYYYEEYDNDTSDFVIYANINEESKIRTRFYFDKNEIIYIKNIIQNGDEIQEELIKASLVYDIDKNLFEIPDNYAELEE